MTSPTLRRPGDVHTDNIIRPNFDELSEKQKQEYETAKEKRQKELYFFIRRIKSSKHHRSRHMNMILATLTKERQGVITKATEMEFKSMSLL
jgi:hypothetical protein